MAFTSGIPGQADCPGAPHPQAQKSELRVRRAWCLAEALPRPHICLPLRLTWIQSSGESGRVWAWVIPLALASGTINRDE